MKAPAVQSKVVLVTGCSTGIGRATAVLLRDRGWEVYPTARKADDLDCLRAEGFTPIRLDVADSESVREAAKQAVSNAPGGLGGVVNNAGFGQPGAVEDISREALRRQFEVNVFGMQELTNALIPTLRKQGYGRIVNISSVLGRIILPFNGVYSASKFAMEALSDALRIELDGSGVAVCLVEPGPIVSNFGQNAAANMVENLDMEAAQFGSIYRKGIENRRKRPRRPGRFTLPPEAVARKVAHALDSSRPRWRYRVTMHAHAGEIIRRFFPDALADQVLRRFARKRLSGIEAQARGEAR